MGRLLLCMQVVSFITEVSYMFLAHETLGDANYRGQKSFRTFEERTLILIIALGTSSDSLEME